VGWFRRGLNFQASQDTQKQQAQKPSGLTMRSLGEKLVAGAIAGIIGTICTFPLDLVKTRLQNQKPGPTGVMPYKGMVDCFTQTAKADGFRGLYRGMPAVLVGITPEKAIKLGMNDFMCDYFRNRLGVTDLPLSYLGLSGGIAGMCQVVATNPMEIVKIRMQVQGTAPGIARQSIGEVVRELGFFGLYTGLRATLMRDVPFSVIYFATYGFVKQKLTDDTGYISNWKVFLTAFIAGTCASSSSTPADVIKTRLQVKPAAGQAPYKGIVDCARQTVAKEGVKALFKGIGPRIIVISPLFGIALVVYEVQKKLLAKFNI
jgi:solute carrier family 25 aspartate/glutamate transporter 12/13